MTSIRPHKKSRLGCKQCKSRRIKCDERAPACGSCARKGLECDFQQYAALFQHARMLTPPVSLGERSPPREEAGTTTQSNDACPSAALLPTPSASTSLSRPLFPFTLEDLGLLHHFTVHTAPTVPVVESDLYCHIWRIEVPRLAQHHAFLMHALLGFAAAHQLASSPCVPTPEQFSVVRRHYTQALGLFREVVHELDESRAEALLCFSVLTCFLTLYFECSSPLADNDVMNGVVIFLTNVQNATRCLVHVRDHLSKSTIGVLLSHKWGKEAHAIEPAAEQSLQTLDALTRAYLFPNNATSRPDDMDECSVLLVALVKLRRMFTMADPKERGWSFILGWPASLDSSFVTLLGEKNPIALCALAHWCVPIYHAPPKWWVAGWPTKVLMTIARHLRGTQWEAGIEWPLKATIGELDR